MSIRPRSVRVFLDRPSTLTGLATWFVLMAPVPAQVCPPSPSAPSDPPYPSDPCASTHAVEGLINGNFERLVPCGLLGPSLTGGPATTPVDGAFWVGAEGMTTTEASGNRFLRFDATPLMQGFVYQRIPAVDDGVGTNGVALASGITLGARVRLARDNDEAWISLTEADREHYTLSGFLSATDNSIHYRGYPVKPAPLASCDLDPTLPPSNQHTPANPNVSWQVRWETTDSGNVRTSQPMHWYYPYELHGCWQPPVPSLNWTPLAPTPTFEGARQVVKFFSPPDPGTPLPSVGLPNSVDTLETNIANAQVSLAAFQPGTIVTRSVAVDFIASRPGCVRVGTRYWAPPSLPLASNVQIEVLHQPASPPGSPPILLRDEVVQVGDDDGFVALDRVAISDGDRITFRFTSLDPSRPTTMFCDPVVVYEGRRLTYRLKTPGNALPPPPTPNTNEVFVRVDVAATGQWTAANLPAGADWAGAWPNDPPRPPLEVELGGRVATTGAVDIDDASALSPLCDAPSTVLAQSVESMIGWQREISELTRERRLPRNLPDPFDCYRAYAQAGAFVLNPTTGLPVFRREGDYPLGILDRLEIDFDPLEHADASWIAEQSWYYRYSPGQFPAGIFDSIDDAWDAETWQSGQPCTDTVGLDSASDALDAYELTGDVTHLDTAARIAEQAILYGVRDSSACPGTGHWWDGLIAIDDWAACSSSAMPTEEQPIDCAPPLLIYSFDQTSMVLRIYVAMRRHDLEHGTTRYANYYTGANSWSPVLERAVAALQAGVDDHFDVTTPTSPFHCGVPAGGASCTNPPTPSPNPDWWDVGWHELPFQFNDVLGYVNGATRVRLDLGALVDELCLVGPGAATQHELQMLCRLDAITTSGVERLMAPWYEALARGEFNGGDQVRAWVSFFDNPTVTNSCAPGQTAATMVLDAARYFMKMQYPVNYNGQYRGVVWLNTTTDPLQLPVLVGPQPGIPAQYYAEGIALALALANQHATPAVRREMRAYLHTLLRANRLRYQETPGLDLDFGFLPRAPGFPGFNVDPAKVQVGGADRRVVERLYEFVDIAGWEGFGSAASRRAPTVTVLPDSFAPATTSFTVTVQLPAGSTSTPLDAYQARTRIGWWREVTAAGTTTWEFEEIWPGPNPDFTVSANVCQTSANPIQITVTPQPGVIVSPMEFKFTAWSWEPNGAWDQDTAYQVW